MSRVNPLIFPDPEYVQEFTPPPAEDGTPINKTWYWSPATSSQDSGHWELRTPDIKEMTWTARTPLIVRRKYDVDGMQSDGEFDPYADTIVYGIDLTTIGAVSYSYTYNVSWLNGPTECFVIEGYHNPRLVLLRGNKYTFEYNDAAPYEMYFHNEIIKDDRSEFNLYEEGVSRDEQEKSVTFIVPADAPPKLLYGPQPELFISGRSGEIAIEDKVQL